MCVCVCVCVCVYVGPYACNLAFPLLSSISPSPLAQVPVPPGLNLDKPLDKDSAKVFDVSKDEKESFDISAVSFLGLSGRTPAALEAARYELQSESSSEGSAEGEGDYVLVFVVVCDCLCC